MSAAWGAGARGWPKPWSMPIPLPAGAAVLDAGCGTGALSAAVARRDAAARMTGVDLSEAFLAAARTRLPGATFMVGDVTRLDLPVAASMRRCRCWCCNSCPTARRRRPSWRGWLKPGGLVAAAMWDFTGGFAFLRASIDTVAATEPEGEAFRARHWSDPVGHRRGACRRCCAMPGLSRWTNATSPSARTARIPPIGGTRGRPAGRASPARSSPRCPPTGGPASRPWRRRAYCAGAPEGRGPSSRWRGWRPGGGGRAGLIPTTRSLTRAAAANAAWRRSGEPWGRAGAIERVDNGARASSRGSPPFCPSPADPGGRRSRHRGTFGIVLGASACIQENRGGSHARDQPPVGSRDTPACRAGARPCPVLAATKPDPHHRPGRGRRHDRHHGPAGRAVPACALGHRPSWWRTAPAPAAPSARWKWCASRPDGTTLLLWQYRAAGDRLFAVPQHALPGRADRADRRHHRAGRTCWW